MYPKEIIKSSKLVYIDRDFYNPNDNPIYFKGKDCFFKEVEDLDKYINELLGTLIAPKFDLKTIKYKLACMETESFTYYGLISESFIKDNKKYIMADKITKTNRIPIGLENLEQIKLFFKQNKNYELFILELLKMSILDFYMNQIDRVKENFYIIEGNDKLSLAPLYDYSESFNSIYNDYTYDYTFNYPSNRYTSSYVYGNAIMKLVFPSDELYELFNKYPMFYEYFKGILNIDMKQLLETINTKYDITLPKELKEHYLDYDKEKKEFVKSLI